MTTKTVYSVRIVGPSGGNLWVDGGYDTPRDAERAGTKQLLGLWPIDTTGYAVIVDSLTVRDLVEE